MCEWYDVDARGSEKRHVRDIETWEEVGGGQRKALECEASGHRQALLGGLGLSEESKTVNSAAVKPEAIG